MRSVGERGSNRVTEKYRVSDELSDGDSDADAEDRAQHVDMEMFEDDESTLAETVGNVELQSSIRVNEERGTIVVVSQKQKEEL